MKYYLNNIKSLKLTTCKLLFLGTKTDQNAILSHVNTTEVGQVVPSHNCHIQSNIQPLHLHQTVKYSKLINTFHCKMASANEKMLYMCGEIPYSNCDKSAGWHNKMQTLPSG